MTPNVYVLCALAALALAIFILVLLLRRQTRAHRAEKLTLEKRAADAQLALNRAEVVHRQAVEEARLEANARATGAVKSAALTLQTHSYGLAGLLERFEAKHGGNPDVLQDFLAVDHKNSMMALRAGGIVTLCGGFPGRRTSAATLYDVLRGAVGRIEDHQRVELPPHSDLGVVGQAVEALSVVFAELLGNATSYSPPDTRVFVTTQRVANGFTVMIEDGGVGMSPEKQQHATRLLSADRPIDITDLGNPPHFGFPVIGVLQQRHGFRVSVDRQSAWGGVRAVVMIPEELLTTVTAEQPENHVSPAAPHVQPEGPALVATPEEPAERTTSGGLPVRNRHRRAAASPLPPQAAPEQPSFPASSGRSKASTMGAFARRSGSPRTGSENEEGRESQ